MKSSVKVAALAIGSFVLLLWGMGISSGTTTGSSTTTSTSMGGHGSTTAAVEPAAATDTTASRPTAPDFTLTTLEGETITLSDYQGEKPVILDFWASWCHNCQRAFPKTARLYDEYSDQVEIIGVNLKESASAAQAFVDRTGATFPNGLDAGSISGSYGVRYTNTHVLIDIDGGIVDMFASDLTEAHIEALLGA